MIYKSIFVYTEQYTMYAFSLISEYLPIDIQKSLLKHLGLPEKVVCNKRKAGGNITDDVNKKVKHSDNHYDEKLNKVEKVNLLFNIIFLLLFRFNDSVFSAIRLLLQRYLLKTKH